MDVHSRTCNGQCTAQECQVVWFAGKVSCWSAGSECEAGKSVTVPRRRGIDILSSMQAGRLSKEGLVHRQMLAVSHLLKRKIQSVEEWREERLVDGQVNQHVGHHEAGCHSNEKDRLDAFVPV